MLAALHGFRWSDERENELQTAIGGAGLAGERLMVFVEAATKGRFAQRLARETHEREPPLYIANALRYLIGR